MLTSPTSSGQPPAFASVCISLKLGLVLGFWGLTKRPMAPFFEMSSRSTSVRFAGSSPAEGAYAGNVPARPIEALHQTNFERIAAKLEHDRDG